MKNMKKLQFFAILLALVTLFVGCPQPTDSGSGGTGSGGESVGGDNSGNDGNGGVTPPPPGTVAQPIFAPGSSTVADGTKFSLASTTEGADIYYTFGNTEYSAGDWEEYRNPVTLSFGANTRINVKAIARKEGMTNSDVTSVIYNKAGGSGGDNTVTLEEVRAIANNPKYNGKDSIDTIRSLLETGIDAKSGGGSTSLILASYYGYTEIVEALIAADANLDIKGGSGTTALMQATSRGYTEIAKALITAGANLDIKRDNGWTALIEASNGGRTEIAKALIAADANLDSMSNDGYTALLWAAYRGHTEVVRALLDANADKSIQNNSNKTALDLARENNVNGSHDEIIALLIPPVKQWYLADFSETEYPEGDTWTILDGNATADGYSKFSGLRKAFAALPSNKTINFVFPNLTSFPPGALSSFRNANGAKATVRADKATTTGEQLFNYSGGIIEASLPLVNSIKSSDFYNSGITKLTIATNSQLESITTAGFNGVGECLEIDITTSAQNAQNVQGVNVAYIKDSKGTIVGPFKSVNGATTSAGWYLSSFSSAAYPEGDTWTIVDTDATADSQYDFDGLDSAVGDALTFKKRNINLVFTNLTSFPSEAFRGFAASGFSKATVTADKVTTTNGGVFSEAYAINIANLPSLTTIKDSDFYNSGITILTIGMNNFLKEVSSDAFSDADLRRIEITTNPQNTPGPNSAYISPQNGDRVGPFKKVNNANGY